MSTNLDASDSKINVYHNEQGDVAGHHLTSDEVKHGDKALKILGEERIELTEEDVSVSSLFPCF